MHQGTRLEKNGNTVVNRNQSELEQLQKKDVDKLFIKLPPKNDPKLATASEYQIISHPASLMYNKRITSQSKHLLSKCG